ncbi:hypothetical protein D3C85_1239440 [compost metagenome]
MKKIFKYLEMALEENRDDIKGRVFLLLDTDKAFEKYDASEGIEQIKIKRIHNDENEYKTLLKATSNTEFYPPTVIEDTLTPSDFILTLESFEEDKEYGESVSSILKFVSSENDELPAALAFDLTGTQQRNMEDLFNMPGFKVKFALRYSELANALDPPTWMSEVEAFLFSRKRRARPAK